MDYILLLVLLRLSFFFSGTETAITAVSSSQLYDMAKRGNKKAGKLNQLKQNPANLLGTLLLGNNVVNIALTALTTALMIDTFGDKYGVIIATFGVSFFVLIFAEILPKTYAIHNAMPFSMTTVSALSFLTICLSPFVKGFNVIAQFIMRLLPQENQADTTGDKMKAEIRGALLMPENACQSFDIEQERGMVKSVLELADVAISDIMCHRSKMISIDVDSSLDEMINFFTSTPYSRIPLWQNSPDNIIGILHAKSFLKAVANHYKTNEKINILAYTSTPKVVLNTTSLLEQLHAFKRQREHVALVVDEYGAIEGLVSLEDILEEIVGNISDESDNIESSQLQFTTHPNGAIELDGNETIRDINRHFKWDLPDTIAPTIAGYILEHTERIPNIGESFTINNFTYTITQKQKNRLAKISILPTQQ